MNNRRMIAIFIIVLAILILGVIIYLLFFYRISQDFNILQKDESITENSPATLTVAREVVKVVGDDKEENTKIATTKEISEANLVKMAFSFAERFGSYSNYSDYENITDLKIFMSKKMIAWADKFIKDSRAESDYSEIYQGVITKAISQEVKEINEEAGIAEILIKTQQIESSGSRNNSSISYKDILISFIKEDGVWKVDSAYFQ